MMDRCERCGDLLFSWEKHFCEEFTVFDDFNEEHTVYAKDEEDAALRFAKEYNEYGDYALMNNSIYITVNGTQFSISAEQSVEYSVMEA